MTCSTEHLAFENYLINCGFTKNTVDTYMRVAIMAGESNSLNDLVKQWQSLISAPLKYGFKHYLTWLGHDVNSEKIRVLFSEFKISHHSKSNLLREMNSLRDMSSIPINSIENDYHLRNLVILELSSMGFSASEIAKLQWTDIKIGRFVVIAGISCSNTNIILDYKRWFDMSGIESDYFLVSRTLRKLDRTTVWRIVGNSQKLKISGACKLFDSNFDDCFGELY